MSLFAGERETLGPTIIVADGTANPLSIQSPTGTVLYSVDSNGATAITTADKLTVGGVIIPAEEYISWPLSATMPNSDIGVFNRAIKITRIDVTVSVVGGSGAKVDARKITDTSAPNAAAGATVKEFLATPGLPLSTGNITLNTVTNGPLSATASDITLAAGNRIALNMSGTLTGLVGQITITFIRV